MPATANRLSMGGFLPLDARWPPVGSGAGHLGWLPMMSPLG
jgi:hypothetical protein